MANTRYAIELKPRPGVGGSPTLLVDMLTSAAPGRGRLNSHVLQLAWNADEIVARRPRETPVRIDPDSIRRIQISRAPDSYEVAVTIDTIHGTGLTLITTPDEPWLADGLPELATTGIPVRWSLTRELASLAVHLGGTISRMPPRRPAPSDVPSPRRVHHGESWTVVDEEGDRLAPRRGTSELEHVSPFSEGLAATRIDGRWGFMDRFGHIALEPGAEEVQSFTSGLAAVCRDGSWQYIDRGGRRRIPRRFQGARPFSEGLAAVSIDDQWGYIDGTGAWAIRPRFDAAGPFSDGLAACSSEGRFGVIDRHGAWRVAPRYDHAFRAGDGLVAVRSGDLWGFVTNRGATAIRPTFDAPGRFENGIGQLIGGVEIDIFGRVLGERGLAGAPSGFVIEPGDDGVRFRPLATPRNEQDIPGICAVEFDEARPFACGLAAARRDDRWGFVDRSGVWLADVSALEVGDFSEGLAPTQDPDDERWRFVGLDGNTISDQGFSEVGAFREGIAPVRVDGGWRMLTSTGALVGPVVDALHPMSEGWAPARVGVYWGALDIQGEWGLAPGMAALGALRNGVARARIANRWSKIVVPHWWLSWTRESA